MTKEAWVPSLVIAMSCGGVSMPGEGSDDEKGGTGATGVGGTSWGKGGTAGRGGSIAIGGTSGVGGEPGGGAPSCRFEPIQKGLRCENAGSRIQDATSVRVMGATSIEQCEALCLERPDCTAVTDYFDEIGASECYLFGGSCNVIGTENWAEEDAAKYYRKVCNASGTCELQYLGHWMMCQDAAAPTERTGATSRADCDAACLASSTCTGVRDLFWIADIVGCYLYTSTCSSPEPLPAGDSGRTYRKVCD